MGYNEAEGRKGVNKLIREKKSVTQENFILIIKEEWKDIDVNLCENLVSSMSTRLALVLESRGRKIDY